MTLEALYVYHCARPIAIAPHLPRLRALAADCALAVEFGVKKGASSTALLLGAEKVFSVDVLETKEARELERIAGDRWAYRIADSRTIEIPPCDLLLLDSHHDYDQVRAELAAHASKVRKFLVFHDHLTFGSVGARDETGVQKWTYTPGKSVPIECLGIRHAIDEFQIAHPAWRTAAAYPDSHGLLVLERRA